MSKQNIKHSSLTHFMRRKCNHKMVACILARCDMSPRVGGLPPQLVPLVRPENRAAVTDLFGDCLENLLINNKDKISKANSEITFVAHDISALFGTECVIMSRGDSIFGQCSLGGAFGFVCKVSFPKINAEYALKYFQAADAENGPLFEISTAFAANHAEPRDNCPIYMASLHPGREFMLSKWAGVVADGYIRENKNAIYLTDEIECHKRNWRGGRRIDYGRTFQTNYGCVSYSVRKKFRQILWAARHNYDIERMYHAARTVHDKNDFIHAMNQARVAAFRDNEYSTMDAIEYAMHSIER